MSQDEAFTYNGVTIGGTSATTRILGRFGFHETKSSAEFTCRFVIFVTGDFTTPADATAALAAAKAPIEAALRTENQRLEIKWAGQRQLVFEPDPAAGDSPATGFNQDPELTKLEDASSTGDSVGYLFTCRVGLPPNYTDANGRRTSSVKLHYDERERPVVTVTGIYTELPGLTARQAFEDDIDDYAASRLALIDPAATWAITRKEEEDDNFENVLVFWRDYSEHVNGRRGSTIEIRFAPSRLREITIRGTYLRTTAGSAASASENYATSQDADDVAVLGALTDFQGGPLTPGEDCQLASEVAIPNEQDDRLDFVRIYRQLNFQESGEASVLADPDVCLDSVVFTSSYTPNQDSLVPGGQTGAAVVAGSVAGVLGSPPSGAPSSGSSSPGGDTVDRGSSPPPATQDGGGGGGGAGAAIAAKPVELTVRYEASINIENVTEDQLRQKWESSLFPYLTGLIEDHLGFPPDALVAHVPAFNVTASRISGEIRCQGFPSDLIAFRITESIEIDWGIRLRRVAKGKAYAYVVQQGLPRQTKTRVVAATYLSNGSFKGVDGFGSTTQIPGWVLLRTSKPNKVNWSFGIPGAIGEIPLTTEALVEGLEYVAEQVNPVTL